MCFSKVLRCPICRLYNDAANLDGQDKLHFARMHAQKGGWQNHAIGCGERQIDILAASRHAFNFTLANKPVKKTTGQSRSSKMDAEPNPSLMRKWYVLAGS